MNDERLRLRKLIEHWIEHNEEHATRFEESAREAERMSLTSAAANLKLASEKARQVSEHLRKAIETI